MESTNKAFSEIQEIIWRTSLSNEIQLPEVVVVGGQSAGKSTVLESLIGFEILPKGDGIQTRCPIRICLHKIRDGKEYATCSGFDTEEMAISQLREAIQTQSARLTQEDYITRTPITVHIYSREVMNLTVVDTPGLTQIRLENQPEDIVATLQSIARQYISNKNTIILAITNAVNDLATSEALRMALEVDKELVRTVGVLTKIDMMNPNSNCIEVMENKQFKLKLGFVGNSCLMINLIVQCSYRKNDKDEDVDFKEILRVEKRYFENHDVYRKHASKFGIPVLKDKLSLIFNQKIREFIPSLIESIKVKKLEIKEKLKAYADLKSKSSCKYNSMASIVINNAFNQIKERVLGYYEEYNSNGEVEGGAKLRQIFDLYQTRMKEHEKFNVEEVEITNLWKNVNALDEHGVLKSCLVKSVMPKFFEHIVKTIKECLNSIDESFQETINSIQIDEFNQYKNLKIFFYKSILAVLKRNKKLTDQNLDFLVLLEMRYINPHDPEIVDLADTRHDISSTYKLLKGYYELSRKALDKSVPKYIMYYFIDKTQTEAYLEMMEKVAIPEFAMSMFKQDQLRIDAYSILKMEKVEMVSLMGKLEDLESQF